MYAHGSAIQVTPSLETHAVNSIQINLTNWKEVKGDGCRINNANNNLVEVCTIR